jgi:antitoxin component YwqK of YwqJK toxin-antitoxin module
MKPFFAILLFLSALLFVACNSPKTPSANQTKAIDTPSVKSNDDTLVYAPEYYENGNLKAEGHLQKGLREGKWIAYSSDGRIMSSCEYSRGRKNGQSQVFNPNGTVKYTAYYRMDEKDGIWVLNDEQGKKVKEVNYNRGTNP